MGLIYDTITQPVFRHTHNARTWKPRLLIDPIVTVDFHSIPRPTLCFLATAADSDSGRSQSRAAGRVTWR